MISHQVLFCHSRLLNSFRVNPFLPSPATSFVGNIMSSLAACNTHIEFSPLASLFGFLAVLDLCCCAQAFSSGKELGLLFLVVPRLLTEVSSLVEHRL